MTMTPGGRLLDLSSDLLQRICSSLSAKERVRLFSTCKQLLHFGSTDPWCLEQLATLELETDHDSLDALSLTRWLRSRLGCLRRLKLTDKAEHGNQASVPMVLLGALAGAPLVSLALQAWESTTGFSHLDVGSWVRAFPQLKHLELVSMHLTVRLPLSSLTGLTSLSLSLKDPDHFNMVRLYMDDHCLPGSLRHLYLDGFAALPAAVTKAPQLEQLYISSDPGAFLGSHLSGLGALTGLTALRIEGYLSHLPADLTSLQKLKVLDLWCNCLWQDGNAAPEAKLLSSLSKLEKLYLHYSTGPEGDIQGLSLKLPTLKVLSLAKIPLASLPELPFGSLEKLELDWDLAVEGYQLFSQMTRLQELRLGLFGQFDGLPEDEKQVVLRELPHLWEALSQLESLKQVWLCRYAVIDLVGKGHEFAAAKQWGKQLTGGVRVLLGAYMEGKDYFAVKGYYDSGGFHHEFATAWDAVE